MDKRTLIFLVGMTIVFFIMHQIFDFGVGSKTPAFNQPQTKVIIAGEGVSGGPMTPAEEKGLNIVSLYSDFEMTKFVMKGIQQRDAFISIAPKLDLPEVAYVKSGNGTPVAVRFQLMVKPEKIQDPILYSTFHLAKLETPWLPDHGSNDIIGVYFDGPHVYSVKGKTENIKELTLDQAPPKNTLLLFNFMGEYQPYGFYIASSNTINYLQEYKPFQNFDIFTYPEVSGEGYHYRHQEGYVLENEYVQLVFSRINGAISEINLPFTSEQNPKSVVREIGIDREIKTDYPDYDRFPQNPYFVADGKGGKVVMQPKTGGYYPLLRRGLVVTDNSTLTTIKPYYYAFNITEKDQPPEPKEYTVKRFEKNLIELEFSDQHRKITKTFKLPDNPDECPYCLDLTVKTEGDARNLVLSLGVPEVELISGSFNPNLKYRTFRNGKPVVEDIKIPKDVVNFSHISADWYSNGNGFFGVILNPKEKSPAGLEVVANSGELVPSRISVIDAQYQRYPVDKFPGYVLNAPLPSKPSTTHYRIYTGPFDEKILKQVDIGLTDPTTGANPDFVAAKSPHGWFAFISQPFAKFLYIILNFFHSITSSWGISIILLTVVLRIMLYPLNNWSMKSTAKLQKIAPKLQAIQEKYKKDPKRAQMEIMNLYRQEGANPFGGCLPMLIQLPFLFGMFDLLKTSFQLRGASFIPGWIDNLTAPDVLFSWDYPLPLIGTTFHLLPILLGVIMFFQQRMMAPASSSTPTDQQRQQRFMGNIMTIVFTVMFYNFPSGLNIYWISSMLLGILQQWWVNKQLLAKGK
ncbi:MAG: membrane protein insertase YidC [Verrucomicrobia bacterium]|nr:membrane protein insertase YidC [Verrucomicrobiota bacterium]